MAAKNPTPVIAAAGYKRCASCVHWAEHDGGYGGCEPAEAFSIWPMRPSGMGSVETRIDFGCVMHKYDNGRRASDDQAGKGGPQE